MTDECWPAPGAEDGSLHWLKPANHAAQIWWWEAGEWRDRIGYARSPQVQAQWGYAYHAPASPDDAAERKRLADENVRLLEALQTIADGEFDCAPGQRFIAAQELARETIGNGSAS